MVGDDDSESRGDQRLDLAVPAIPEFRETMEQDHHGAVFGPGGDGMEPQSSVLKKMYGRFALCARGLPPFRGNAVASVGKNDLKGFLFASRKESGALHFDFVEDRHQLFRIALPPEPISPDFEWASSAFENVTTDIFGRPKKRFPLGHLGSAHFT